MEKSTKVEVDELRQATQIRQTFADLTHEYGKLAFVQRTIDREQATVGERFDTLVKEEEQFIKELIDKYGSGTLNVETGEFTPENG